jgi:hypothetical protein
MEGKVAVFTYTEKLQSTTTVLYIFLYSFMFILKILGPYVGASTCSIHIQGHRKRMPGL